jgi:hypothetical protein
MNLRLIGPGLVAVVALGAAFAPACSDSGTGGTGGTTSGTGCSIGGTKCPSQCEPNIGCAVCATNAGCTDPTKPACVAGACRECGDGAPCGAASACFPNDHKCHPKCATNADCPGDSPTCVVATGTCVGCQLNADCIDPAAPVCEPTSAQCRQCGTSADCGAAEPACDINDGKCHECLVDGDCKAPLVCGTDRKCHQTCSSASCTDPSKPFCDPAANACVACLSNVDCGVALPICSAGKCVAN